MTDRFEPELTIARLTDEVERLRKEKAKLTTSRDGWRRFAGEHSPQWADEMRARIAELDAANAKLSEELALECAAGDWMRKRLAEQREAEEADDD